VRAPTAYELLAVWERCAARTPAERAVELLALASPDAPGDELAALTVGKRDELLLDLRERAFGSRLAAGGRCAACGEPVEFTLEADELYVAEPERPTELSLSVDGYELRFRLATGADLAAVSRALDAEVARSRLLARCVLEARRDGAEVPVATLPRAVVEALAGRMAAADPQADVELGLSCPACGHAWKASFDPASFLWSELDAWTRQTLHDVHTLATAYGWTESEVLALGARRHVYLELAGA